ncbi:hypothetical protein EJ07DRAFT_150617 [Lizonia empirigonia]|nr:hypothetical protein EJ07DRAFT_150617 [Lizonia empirigonia]
MKLEHTLKLSDKDFRSLNGAPAALQAFRQGNQTEDEEDDGYCTFLGQLPSYIGSWLAQLLPRERILDFSCAGVFPSATTTRIDMNTQLPVHENDVAPQTARNHVQQERPADRTPAFSTAANTNSCTTLPADEFAGVPENKPNTNTFSRECKICKKTFHYQQSFDFDQEKHKMEKALREETADQGFTFSGAVRIQSLVESTPWDHFPQYATPSVTHGSTMAADTSLLVNVRDLIWIKCVDATTQGVHGRDVLVRTTSNTIQLVPTVSFSALVSRKVIAERHEPIRQRLTPRCGGCTVISASTTGTPKCFQPPLVLYRQHSLTSAADLPSGDDAGCGGMAVAHCPFLVACEEIFGIRYDVADVATNLSPSVPQTYPGNSTRIGYTLHHRIASASHH